MQSDNETVPAAAASPAEQSTRRGIIKRAIDAYRRKGLTYAWYKVLKRLTQDRVYLGRLLLYRSPRWYWEQRGGYDYFLEQEAQADRSTRSQHIAHRIACYRPTSILEIGCGYGKQLSSLRGLLDVPMTGVDWSESQLHLASKFLSDRPDIQLMRSAGDQLPFEDNSFDLVLTSAVILHNPPPVAKRICSEIIRVGTRFAVHNEDTNVSFSRFGYDLAGAYANAGFRLLECGPIPGVQDSRISQLCVADLQSPAASLSRFELTPGSHPDNAGAGKSCAP